MFKIFFYHFGKGLLADVIVTVISVLFTFLVALIFGTFTGPILPMVFGIIGGTIVAFLASGLIASNKNFLHKEATRRNSFEKLWYAVSVEKKKKINIGKIFLLMLPFILILGVFIFFTVLQLPIAAKVVWTGKNQTPNGVVKVLLATGLANSSIVWLFYIFFLLNAYGRTRCGCGGVMCYINDKLTDFHSDTYVETKTKDTYGKIGDLYVDNEKVGEVNGKTGSYSLKREVHSSSSTYDCSCVFCGKIKPFSEGSRNYTSNWHY